jgi:hypothetical protein
VRNALVLSVLLVSGACAARTPEPPSIASEPPVWRFLRQKYDADGDGRVARAEYTRSSAGYARLDADRDGVVTAADFDARWDGVVRNAEGELVYGEGGPAPGESAPEFELETTAGERVALADFRGKRPVALIFGSFT